MKTLSEKRSEFFKWLAENNATKTKTYDQITLAAAEIFAPPVEPVEVIEGPAKLPKGNVWMLDSGSVKWAYWGDAPLAKGCRAIRVGPLPTFPPRVVMPAGPKPEVKAWRRTHDASQVFYGCEINGVVYRIGSKDQYNVSTCELIEEKSC